MSKRHPSPDLIPNPFIKKRNLTWTIDDLSQSNEPAHGDNSSDHKTPRSQDHQLPAAAIEAGQVQITDHLSHFSSLLSSHVLQNLIPSQSAKHVPLLSIDDYSSLYTSNSGSRYGAHFVIHQHDHPVAGTHYDLRLQINETSSASWAIMYGLPGDPNSKRLNRNATETRIHCFWNHLVESASPSTGSLLIWDTGTYSILPRRSKYAPSLDPSSPTSSPSSSSSSSLPQTQQEKLHAAFQNRKIRLRLHGSKLPDPYVLNLRLTKPEDAAGRLRSKRVPKFRRRRGGGVSAQKAPQTSSSSSSESESEDKTQVLAGKAETSGAGGTEDPHVTSAMERELRELEDANVRATNAYPGAHNSIGSVHQRRWYLSLDRAASGFVRPKGGSRWELASNGQRAGGEVGERESAERKDEESGQKSNRLDWPFYVRGSAWERSVITGRTGADVLRDESVTGFIPRKGWTPVLN